MSRFSNIERSSKRILIFALVMRLWAIITSWICLLGILRPHQWLLAANIARWIWLIVYSALTLWGVFGIVMSRLALKPKRPYLSQKNWGTFFGLIILVLLVVGRFDLAVALIYGQGARQALRRLRSGPDVTKGETRYFLQFQSACKVLALAFCVSALMLHSLPFLVWLVAIDIITWLAPLPQIPQQLISIQSQIRTQSKPSAPQTNST
ncbi:hypothetical protein IAD21_06091 [Abditibacteriota bacterium]|nr:hypothetical protein IAD21_06091 [Abditibacteriota bacterium]